MPTSTESTPSLSIQLNRYNLQRYATLANQWAGTIFHEFLHNLGLRHPNGYEGSLIKEAGLSLARTFEDKGFGLVEFVPGCDARYGTTSGGQNQHQSGWDW